MLLSDLDVAKLFESILYIYNTCKCFKSCGWMLKRILGVKLAKCVKLEWLKAMHDKVCALTDTFRESYTAVNGQKI